MTHHPAARAHRTVRSVAVAVVMAVSVAGAVVAPVGSDVTVAAAASEPSAFEPVAPCRLLDTRTSGAIPAGGVVDVTVAGRCDVPEGAVAAALTITAVLPERPGFVIAYPTGSSRPEASALNYRGGDVVANLQIVRLGTDGQVSFFTPAGTDLVVDVSGGFVPAVGGTARSGRYEPVEQRRLVDTRVVGRPGPGGVVRIDPGVPNDAIAVAINITTTDTVGADFFVGYRVGDGRPEASVLNADGPGETRAAAAIVPVSSGGFDVYTYRGNHVIVDLLGYFTGPSAEPSGDGLFVGVVPTRLVDTRLPAGPSGGPRLWDHGTRELDVRGITGGEVGAVVANLTVTQTEDVGFLSARAAGTPDRGTSSLNYVEAGMTVANHAIVGVSDRGIAVTALDATHLVVDVTGWFTGRPVAATEPVAPNTPPPPRRVTVITDSAGAGIRWNGATGGFQGFVPVIKMESCRRLVQSSCRGREGYAPRTATNEILNLPPAGPEEILVIAVGYNDWHERFASDFDTVVGAARSKGFRHIAWIDYRTGVGYSLPGSGGVRSSYVEMNRIIGEKLASGDYPDVRRWHFDLYAAATSGWFYSDGVHQTPLGSWGVADWISRHVRAFDDVACAQPWVPGGAIESPCPDPDPLSAVRGAPDIAGIYGL